MSLFCKLKHKWEYSTTKVNIHSKAPGAHISITTRICKRCYKKQVRILESGKWDDIKLNVQELREINLKKLGL